jgi:molybdopterin molybdotransferase
MALIPVETALAHIQEGVAALAVETVPLAECLGRVLRTDLPALLTQPPFDASSMDGYALRASDAQTVPARLRVIGEVPAGFIFEGRVEAGEAVRIFTGAALPDGADCVVIQENTAREGDAVIVKEAPRAGENLRKAGGDFRQGDILLAAGQRLGARHLLAAAAMNYAELPVARRPRVAILATGDELVPPGSEPRPGRIVSSIPPALAAMVRLAGGEPLLLGIARDRLESLKEHIERAHGADILVTIGGASAGDYDLVREALVARGMALSFHKIAMRPGKPLMFGALGSQRVLGVPGNPVSALVCARVFLHPLIERYLGLAASPMVTVSAVLEAPLEANGERTHYMRAMLRRDGSGYYAGPVANQDSSLIATLAASGGLIIRPPFAPAAKAGDRVDVFPFDF